MGGRSLSGRMGNVTVSFQTAINISRAWCCAETTPSRSLLDNTQCPLQPKPVTRSTDDESPLSA